MEKLDKVIAGLIACIGSDCGNCEYILDRCESRLLSDALDVVTALRAERDDLRKDVVVLTELLEKADSSMKALRAWREMSEQVIHAHWVPAPDVGDCCYRCSSCGKVIDHYCDEDDLYCARCGAHMDEEVTYE